MQVVLRSTFPFGWPEQFVETVSLHADGSPRPRDMPSSVDLRWRATDRHVFEQTGLRPWSVSTDKIGVPALRWVGIERLLGLSGHPVDRTGVGTFVEAYPAAAPRVWGLPYRSYKGARRRPHLGDLVTHPTRFSRRPNEEAPDRDAPPRRQAPIVMLQQAVVGPRDREIA
jgi:hypothetical protein